jgi:hypothetical protein
MILFIVLHYLPINFISVLISGGLVSPHLLLDGRTTRLRRLGSVRQLLAGPHHQADVRKLLVALPGNAPPLPDGRIHERKMKIKTNQENEKSVFFSNETKKHFYPQKS